jgi:hypothetical protein
VEARVLKPQMFVGSDTVLTAFSANYSKIYGTE